MGQQHTLAAAGIGHQQLLHRHRQRLRLGLPPGKHRQPLHRSYIRPDGFAVQTADACEPGALRFTGGRPAAGLDTECLRGYAFFAGGGDESVGGLWGEIRGEVTSAFRIISGNVWKAMQAAFGTIAFFKYTAYICNYDKFL